MVSLMRLKGNSASLNKSVFIALNFGVKGGGNEAVEYKSKHAENGDFGSVAEAEYGTEAEGGD